MTSRDVRIAELSELLHNLGRALDRQQELLDVVFTSTGANNDCKDMQLPVSFEADVVKLVGQRSGKSMEDSAFNNNANECINGLLHEKFGELRETTPTDAATSGAEHQRRGDKDTIAPLLRRVAYMEWAMERLIRQNHSLEANLAAKEGTANSAHVDRLVLERFDELVEQHIWKALAEDRQKDKARVAYLRWRVKHLEAMLKRKGRDVDQVKIDELVQARFDRLMENYKAELEEVAEQQHDEEIALLRERIADLEAAAVDVAEVVKGDDLEGGTAVDHRPKPGLMEGLCVIS